MEHSNKTSAAVSTATPFAVPTQAATDKPLAPLKVQGRRFNLPIVPALLMALLIGVGIGAFFTRQHYKALDVVVSVNGSTIEKADFYRRLENQSGNTVIRQMVGEELYMQFARKLGKPPTDADVERRLQESMRQPDFMQKLAASHLSYDDLRRTLRTQLAKQAVLTRDVPVTDAEIRHYYDVNVNPANPKALFYTPETAQIAVVVTTTRSRADQAMQSLHNGVPFANVAAVYSQDATRVTGGLLPPILRGRTTSAKFPELENTIFAMRIGSQIGPIQVAGNWWILQCLDKQPAVTQTFAQVKEQCTIGAALNKLSPANAAKIENDFVDFQKHAIVQAFWARYANAVDLK